MLNSMVLNFEAENHNEMIDSVEINEIYSIGQFPNFYITSFHFFFQLIDTIVDFRVVSIG